MAFLLKENFISFPAAEAFPSGPYDLDELTYAIRDDGSFELAMQLGWVYDSYLLQIIVNAAPHWVLWHQDSAVVHVDERKVADNPPFLYQDYSTECDIPLNIHTTHGTVDDRAVRVAFCQPVAPLVFNIEFSLASGSVLCLSSIGWRIKNDSRDGNKALR